MTLRHTPTHPEGPAILPTEKKTRTPFGHDTSGQADPNHLEYLNKIIELYL